MIGTRRRGGRLLSLVAMLAIFGVALHGPLAVAAQDTGVDDSFDFKSLDGFQRGVGRLYMGDLSTMFGSLDSLSTPGAEVETPDMSELGLFMLGGFVAQFDNGDHASSALGTVTDSLVKSVESGDDGITLSEVDVDKLGDQTKAYSGTISEEGMEGTVVYIAVQKGDLVYIGFGLSFGSDPTDQITAFVTDLTKGKPSDGDGTFNEDGTSTGGLWDVFPSSDADYLKGLTPMTDQDLAQDDSM
ncbi:MAG: hypothetical protein QM753_10755 [Thermomicrobiales bacterium]